MVCFNFIVVPITRDAFRDVAALKINRNTLWIFFPSSSSSRVSMSITAFRFSLGSFLLVFMSEKNPVVFSFPLSAPASDHHQFSVEENETSFSGKLHHHHRRHTHSPDTGCHAHTKNSEFWRLSKACLQSCDVSTLSLLLLSCLLSVLYDGTMCHEGQNIDIFLHFNKSKNVCN